MKFSYPSEKFSSARRSLMLPHPNGEASSIASAFHSCTLGLHDIHDEDLDESARDWVAKLNAFMDAAGVQYPVDEGAYIAKAKTLTIDEQYELSRVVDELADWFERRFREELRSGKRGG